MPTTKSAKKRLRQNIVRRGRNRSTRTTLKTLIRRVREAVAAGDAAKAASDFRVATKKLDQAAGTGVIHRNAAARTKSRLSAAIKGMKAKSA
jgi:small subunit ribosomal protein S20